MSSTLKKDLVSGTIWSLIGQFGYLAIALVANIILARLLSPKEFGQMGIALFFIVVARVLTESGLGGALVRNNKATNTDFSTIFLFNLVVSIVLCLLLMLSAGSIAAFYEDESLKNILIVSAFILIINAFQFVQSARLVKNMQFKRKAIYEFTAILVAAVIGISLALNGYGVWAIVFMQLSTALFMAILFWIFEGGIGPWVFNKTSFKAHYKFGVNTTLASILNSVFDNIYQLILGKYFAISQTGLYYQAKKLQEIPVGVVNNLAQSVVFSSLSKIQDDPKQLHNTYQKIISLFTVGVGLICLILFLFANDFILFLYGKQWLDATFFLKILALSSFFYMQEMFNRILFKVYNRTSIILKLEFVKKGIQIVSVAIGLWFMSIELLMYGLLISSIISYFINYTISRKVFYHLGNTEMIALFKSIIIGSIISALYIFIPNIYEIDSFAIKLFSISLTSFIFLVALSMWKVFNIRDSFNLIKLLKK
jgi:teichuronic acid exporter